MVVFHNTGTITAGVPSAARLVVVEEDEGGAVSSLALALAVLGGAESSSGTLAGRCHSQIR